MNPLVLSEFGSRLSISHFHVVVNGEEYEPRQVSKQDYDHYEGHNLLLECRPEVHEKV